MTHLTLAGSLHAAARVLAALLIVFWGIFFVEHLAWFGVWPPPPGRIWIAQVAHLVLLVGLLLSVMRHELIGSAIAIGAASVLILAAGFRDVPWLFWVTVMPAILFAAAHASASRDRARSSSSAGQIHATQARKVRDCEEFPHVLEDFAARTSGKPRVARTRFGRASLHARIGSRIAICNREPRISRRSWHSWRA